jgi:hypothetical protein
MDKIVTAGGKLSGQRDGYLAELVANWLLGYDTSEFMGNAACERGTALEPVAFKCYEFHRDLELKKVGFIFKDEGRILGCSPDALAGDDGLVEFKAPETPGKHLRWLIEGIPPKEHWVQLQSQIYVTGRKWVDFFSYFPALPPFIVRVEKDAKLHQAFDENLPTFITELLQAREKFAEFKVERVAPPISGSRPESQGAPSLLHWGTKESVNGRTT